jgi:SAM-dependent methyltransferase
MHDKEYWSGLYASGRAPSEWFVDPDDLRPILDNAVAAALLTTSLTSTTTTTTSASGIPRVTEVDKTDAAVFRLLDVGCGVSCVGAELIRDWATSTSEWGYEDGSTSTVQRQPPSVCVDAIDFAKTAVDAVTTEQADLIQSGTLRVQVADVLDPAGLPFERARFNLILDKGTLDAIVHGYSGEARDVAIITALSEVDRVARPGCALVHVSDEPPELRLPTLATTLTDWRLSWREVGTGGYTAFAYTGFKKVPE